MRHIREVFVALAVFVFSLTCVVFFVISLIKLGWQRVGPENLLGEMVGPSVKCLCVTAGVAYGVSLLWRASPVVLGVVAAAPLLFPIQLLRVVRVGRWRGILGWCGYRHVCRLCWSHPSTPQTRERGLATDHAHRRGIEPEHLDRNAEP